MALLASIGIKQQDGSYKNYTISITDELDKNNNNVSMFVEQTKEDRDNKVKRKFVGNGRVFWHNGSVKTYKECGSAAPQQQTAANNIIDDDLPL